MIDPKTIVHIAKLARLYVSEDEIIKYGEQLSKVLEQFAQISSISTEGVEPLVTPTEIEGFWREDVPKTELTAEEMLANAPQKTGNLFTVPPVV